MIYHKDIMEIGIYNGLDWLWNIFCEQASLATFSPYFFIVWQKFSLANFFLV